MSRYATNVSSAQGYPAYLPIPERQRDSLLLRRTRRKFFSLPLSRLQEA